MTLQQLQYIVAVDKFRSFAKAADSCGITQPTLSKMVANLEEELDVRIFERNSRNVSPTAIGGRIVAQAGRTLMEAERIREIVAETKDSLSGEFKLSVGPSIAPYILPEFIRHYGEDWPGVSMSIEERRPENMFDALLAGTIDAAISSGGAEGMEFSRFPYMRNRSGSISPSSAGRGSRRSHRRCSAMRICG